ncbi:MAG: hypothetical protein Q4D85_14045 [Corynebacterium sp.]|nr:hypothetical protein [Corynebacterium sp.]MDO5099857.1 hypothetical protein [Corynebacterium sp.]
MSMTSALVARDSLVSATFLPHADTFHACKETHNDEPVAMP